MENSRDSQRLEHEILGGLLELRGDLKNYIFSAIPNWSDSEDVFQDVCLKIWKNKDQFAPGSNFRAWAFTVARYTILDFRKRYAMRRVTYLDIETVEMLADEMVAAGDEKPDRPAYADALASCLAQLSDKLAKMLKSHYKDGYSMADLAEQAGASEPSVKQLLYRTRLKLRDCIKHRISLGLDNGS